ncbi:lysylphosphatidylglycerol synthase transmembrane domain-containing protein [Spirillospora sp. NPDC029432]|uniref:lysylphosphatidylglycerol synthase transmembrane domain-containing protein n=1 Tax=Spirillospora sp. NPDC029432 TaxID=3154599 RepID=UPI00345469D5
MTRSLWPWLRTLAAVAVLAGLVWWHSTGAFVAAARAVTAESAAVALGIGLFTTFCNARRWCLVARRLGLRLSLGTAVGDYYRASFLNAVLPAGVLGDVHRAVSHGRDSGDVGRGVRAVVLERAAGQVVIVAAGLLVLLTRPVLLPALGAVAAAAVAVAAVLAAAGWALRRRLRALAADLRLVREVWPGLALLSAAALAGHVALFLVAARAAGAHAPLADLVPLAVLALLVMGLPVNVGGWGPREAATALAFGAVGLGAAQGLTVAVVYGLLTLVAGLPGAAVPLVRLARRTARPAPPARLRIEQPQMLAERLHQGGEKIPALAGRGQ